MDATEKQKMIGELKIFLKEFKSYERRRASDKQSSEAERRYTEVLRGKLVRKSGKLKETIIQLTGRQFWTRFGMVHNFWANALGPQGDTYDIRLCVDATNEAIGKLETPVAELEVHEVKIAEPPKAFISHGKGGEALLKLEKFLSALGVEPVIVKDQPNLDRPVDRKVEDCLRAADFVIILATGDDKVDDKSQPRQNVIHEIGLAQKTHPGKIVYLLEEGSEFPSNIRPKVYESFARQSMDGAFTAIARELTEMKILKAVKPPKEE